MDIKEEIQSCSSPQLEIKSNRVQNERKIWQANIPYLYDLLISDKLESPSMTVELLPGVEKVENEHLIQRVVLGTSNARGTNYLKVSEIKLPTENAQFDKTRDETAGSGTFGTISGKFVTDVQIPRKQILQKGRYMPQNSNIVAAMSKNSAISVFDVQMYSEQMRGEISKCVALTGQSGGNGLAWNKNKEGLIASTLSNNNVGIWDAKEGGCDVREQIVTLKGHQAVINDVEWHPKNETVLCSVSSDRQLCVWDSRFDRPACKIGNESDGMTSLAFNPASDFLVAIGSEEKMCLWDFRSPGCPLHRFEHCIEPTSRVQWCPLQEHILASSSGNRIKLWDIEKIGQAQSPEDAEDGPPELMFVHAGHLKPVTDFSWSTTDPMAMCSVSEDCVQIWKMAGDVQLGEVQVKTEDNA